MEVIYRNIGIQERKKIIHLWNYNIGCLFPMDEKLFNGNLQMDESINEQSIVGAFLKDKLIGFIIFKKNKVTQGSKDEIRGNINSFIVDFRYRNKGIGSALLNICQEKLREAGVKYIDAGSDTFHFFPGVPIEFKKGVEFLNKRGFKGEYESWDMIGSIENLDLTEIIHDRGLELNTENRYLTKELEYKDRDKLMAFLKESFPGRWYDDTHSFFKWGMQDRDIIVVYDMQINKIVGFSHIYDKNSNVLGPGIYWRHLLENDFGGLGPIGIAKEYRKINLGLTLLYKSLEILQDRGVKKMCIDWTGLFEFYGIFNFIPWKGYIHMAKEID